MTFWLDAREATRRLVRTPFFTAGVVCTLGVGLAVAMLTFAIVDGVWLRPLPYADPDRLVSISPYSISSADLAAVENERATFAAVGGYSLGLPALILPGDEPLVVRRAVVTTNFLELLGVRPASWRTAPGDPAAAGPEVYLTHHLWMQRFGGDPAIVGSLVAFEDRLAPRRGRVAGGLHVPELDPGSDAGRPDDAGIAAARPLDSRDRPAGGPRDDRAGVRRRRSRRAAATPGERSTEHRPVGRDRCPQR